MKIGDKVKVITDGYGERQRGMIGIISAFCPETKDDHGIRVLFDRDEAARRNVPESNIYCECDLELVDPERRFTVTTKTLLPGDYGRLTIGKQSNIDMRLYDLSINEADVSLVSYSELLELSDNLITLIKEMDAP